MEDMISRLSEIFDDPEQSERIRQIASSMLKKEDHGENEPAEAERGALKETLPEAEKHLQNRSSNSYEKLVSSMNCSKNITLLNAIRPYMRSSRAEKIGSAIKAIEMIEILSKIK